MRCRAQSTAILPSVTFDRTCTFNFSVFTTFIYFQTLQWFLTFDLHYHNFIIGAICLTVWNCLSIVQIVFSNLKVANTQVNIFRKIGTDRRKELSIHYDVNVLTVQTNIYAVIRNAPFVLSRKKSKNPINITVCKIQRLDICGKLKIETVCLDDSV